MDVKVQRAESMSEFYPMIENGYYSGEAYSPTVTSRSKFKLNTVQAGLLQLALFSGAKMGMKRSWSHIRSMSCEMYVIWFPQEGTLVVTQDVAHRHRCVAGEFLILYGDRPFHVVTESTAGDDCKNMHVIVPSHLLRSRIPDIDRHCGRSFLANSGPAAVGANVYASLLHEGSRLSDDTLTGFALYSLDAVCEKVRQTASNEPFQVDTKRINLEKALRFIDRHLPLQGLTAADVADACNVSKRYLHYLLQYGGTSFSEYLWNARLDQARQWLIDQEFRHMNIVDIAYSCGFRSASHFSDAYRHRYGCSPRSARLKAID